MTDAEDFRSGKGENDENFPVGSFLIEARHRPAVFAFYRFARTADDVADHERLGVEEKLALLEQMRATLAGESDADAPALALRKVLAERKLTTEHGLDLLEAFRRDVTKLRYTDWDDLMDYCRYSAAPVGRMVLDIHGEPRTTWPANDALCSALQVINHLQDCAKDRRSLDRVYLPAAELAAAGAVLEDLDQPRVSPALKATIEGLAERTLELLNQSRPFAGQIANRRLRLEVAFIQQVAEDLAERLTRRDPLSERVHHNKAELLGLAGGALVRLWRAPRAPARSGAQTARSLP
jgi:squalene synthase HpnC